MTQIHPESDVRPYVVLRFSEGWGIVCRGWKAGRFSTLAQAVRAAERLAGEALALGDRVDLLVQSPFGELERRGPEPAAWETIMEATPRIPELRRQLDAVRLFNEAARLDLEGQEAAALPLYRRAALMGQTYAQSNLGVLLTTVGGRWRAEGVRWLKRAAFAGNATAAWNLAMEERLSENRGAYLRWLAVAARLGHEEALVVQAEIARRRAAGEPWFMLRTALVDALDVAIELDEVREGEETPEDAAEWAAGAIGRRWAVGLDPAQRARLLPVLWEMTAPGLTPQRATELIYKLVG
ncbi:hypothetical protein [Caulobacter sp. 17J80-11]|uniref:hypothetical protein n=1 Tax=Caulobacter sp. 17J80-11 TaxID=2763502 RepID=UPI001653D67E|nr:hypothetical protein [Caulobacter sp. 17J80-11]MBC6982205.1 hypothetical protein [Caulobacter sp. 17J80-11]